VRPRLLIRVAFVAYVLSFAALAALIAGELLHRVVHAIP
jgi:hypothetical protein